MKFDILYPDCPWWYGSRISRGAGTRTRFGNGAPYPLMKDKDLLAMAPLVKEITSDRALMFMWATFPRLDFGIELLKAWGFEYSTVAFVWVKTTHEAARAYQKIDLFGQPFPFEEFLAIFAKKGLGSYTASNVEIVLLGRKGKALPMTRRLPPQVYFEPLREHSRKPDAIRDSIRDHWLAADGSEPKRLEMFCRFPAGGWTATGNQLDENEDIRDALRRLAAL